MKNFKKLPLGIENFEEMRIKNFYYVDKTGLIRELLEEEAKVTLITRPRRFGKSLTISMLRYFFSMEGDKSIFDGLEISKDKDLCKDYMGKYPVIYISLKRIEGDNYQEAFGEMASLIYRVASRFSFLWNSEKLSSPDHSMYNDLLSFHMEKSVLNGSLETLCGLLHRHFGRKAILLIDEYDVPLQKAFLKGYYDQMLSLVRPMLNNALKTNDDLEFAFLTGCLRVSKESIFTGLNNLQVYSITNSTYDEYFGFTSREVQDLLAYYHMESSYDAVKEWYDGYRFGDADVYCPWDLIKYCRDKQKKPDQSPQNYWIHTSGNDEVKRFIEMANEDTRLEIEALAAGETIEKWIREDLTYQNMFDSIDNLWSILYATGYLTQRGKTEKGMLKLAIPNREICVAFVELIWECFRDEVRADSEMLNRFCSALQHRDPLNVEKIFTEYLRGSISVRDYMAKKERKEYFYHGVMLGLLLGKGNWSPKSNPESGDGFADVIATPEEGNLGIGIVIEMKYADDENLDKACQEALDQIEKLHYTEDLQRKKMHTIIKYGVGCYKKTCKVVLGD